jgi:hypothetical protein
MSPCSVPGSKGRVKVPVSPRGIIKRRYITLIILPPPYLYFLCKASEHWSIAPMS